MMAGILASPTSKTAFPTLYVSDFVDLAYNVAYSCRNSSGFPPDSLKPAPVFGVSYQKRFAKI